MQPDIRWLDDPKVFQVNRIPAHSDHTPFAGEADLAAGKSALIQVDGGITEETAGECIKNGADVLVAGTAFFRAPDRAAFVRNLREMENN